MEGYESYDLQDEDPYLIPGSTCLANLLGITDTHALSVAESDITSVAMAGLINKIHPFREGNGRAQRILLDQLAELSGYGFEWAAISGEQMAQACRAARVATPDYSGLQRILRVCITRL